MSEPTLKKAPYETLFAKTYPLQRRFGCKGTTKFADMQILSEKSFRSFKVLRVIGRFLLREQRNAPTV